MAKKFDNLRALDWDDSDLVQAYDVGMTLKGKMSDLSQEDFASYIEWKVGSHCRAMYPGDNKMYEATITNIIDEDICTVAFLGYENEDDIEVRVPYVAKSHGKKARKKQVKNAVKLALLSNDVNDNGNDAKIDESPGHPHSKRKHHKHHKKHVVDYGANFPPSDNLAPANCYPAYQMPPTSAPPHVHAAPSHVHAAPPHVHAAQPHVYAAQPHVHAAPPHVHAAPPPVHAAPPLPQCSQVVRDPAVCSMLTSWYMSGYYTGLYEGQKNSCHQNCCMSSYHC